MTLPTNTIIKAAPVLAFLLMTFLACENNPSANGTVSPFEGAWKGTTHGDTAHFDFVFAGNTVTCRSTSGESYDATFTTDTTMQPKNIDMTITACPDYPAFVGQVALGIYSISGSTMILAGSQPAPQGSGSRPTSLDTTNAGGNTRVFALTR